MPLPSSQKVIEPLWLSGGLIYGEQSHQGSWPTAMLLRDGKIAAIAAHLPENIDRRSVQVLDMTGYVIYPGLVNAHLHSPMGFFRGLSHHQAAAKPGQTLIENFFYPAESRLTPELIKPLAYSSLVDCVKSGVTCVVDSYFFTENMAEAAEAIGLRSFVGEHIADLGGALPAGRDLWLQTKKRIENWRHSSLVKPMVYAHATDTVSQPLLRELVQFAQANNLTFHMHLAQSHGEQERTKQRSGLSPVAYAAQAGALYERALLTHLVTIDAKEAQLIAQSGATFAFCPVSEIIYEHLPPLETIVNAGIPVALGTDCAASNDTSDMIQEMRFNSIMAKHLGLSKAAREPAKLLRWGTSHASKVLGLNSSDLLRVGQDADFFCAKTDIAVEPVHDLATCLLYSMSSRHVRHVMVAGQWILWDGALTRVNEQVLRNEYRQAASAIRQKAGLAPGPI